MEWFKMFVLIFSGVYLIRFIVALIIELFSDDPKNIKTPKLYELTLMTAFSYIITFIIYKI